MTTLPNLLTLLDLAERLEYESLGTDDTELAAELGRMVTGLRRVIDRALEEEVA